MSESTRFTVGGVRSRAWNAGARVKRRFVGAMYRHGLPAITAAVVGAGVVWGAVVWLIIWGSAWIYVTATN